MYTNEIVENLLRCYYTLQTHPSATFSDYKLDLERELKRLKTHSYSLYYTMINVLVNGVPIQRHAEDHRISTRQVGRRLHDGVQLLTMMMNGG